MDNHFVVNFYKFKLFYLCKSIYINNVNSKIYIYIYIYIYINITIHILLLFIMKLIMLLKR